VVDAWMPGARRISARGDGGMLRGGAPRVVWQALSADPRQISASSAAERLDQDGRPPHLVWNPVSGEVTQLIPIVRAACSLGGPEGLEYHGYSPAEPAPTNNQGRLCIQISVMAWPWEPFTDGPMNGLELILDWLDCWKVPCRWPAGPPAPFGHPRGLSRTRAAWAAGGHYGASQVPGWDAAGPGSIDIDLIGGPYETHHAPPRPHQRPETPAAVASRDSRVALETMLAPGMAAGAAPLSSLANAPY
jgi:hypothetical protein